MSDDSRELAADWVACHGVPGAIDQLEALLEYVRKKERERLRNLVVDASIRQPDPDVASGLNHAVWLLSE